MTFTCARPSGPAGRADDVRAGHRRRWRSRAARHLAHLGLAVLGAGSASAAPLPTIVSINLCTDQLALALADPGQIVALSRFARHAEMSYLAGRAAGHPTLRGSAEEVLRRRPDLVLGGAFSGQATRAVLAAQSVDVETFAPPRSIAEARAEVERAARLLGQSTRGAILVAEIDAAVAEAGSAARGRKAPTALAIQRRGFASGRDTLLSAAIEAAGFANAAAALGITGVGHVPLEAIVKLRPDVLILEDLARVADQSTALLHHPVLARVRAGTHVILLPVAEVTCGGPSLAPLIRRLAQHRAAVP